jgi:hypothetical protein
MITSSPTRAHLYSGPIAAGGTLMQPWDPLRKFPPGPKFRCHPASWMKYPLGANGLSVKSYGNAIRYVACRRPPKHISFLARKCYLSFLRSYSELPVEGLDGVTSTDLWLG